MTASEEEGKRKPIDITARFSRAYAGDQPEDEVWMVDFDSPIKRGMEGPHISTSIMPVCEDQLKFVIMACCKHQLGIPRPPPVPKIIRL